MGAPTRWFQRLPEIIARLKALKLPYLDRQAFQQLFGISDRRARILMSRFEGMRLGNAWVVDRLKLIAVLEKIRAGEEYQFEVRRRERVALVLEQAKLEHPSRNVEIKTKPTDQWMTLDTLPVGVKVSATELRIEFTGAEDLLTKLVQIAQAIGNDYESLEAIVSQPKHFEKTS